jgi:hypothetical protein
MRAMLQAQINKTDRNDARGIAQMMRVGLYRPVHVKKLRSQKLRMLLTHRKLLQSKAIAIENDLRGTLRNFGLKVFEDWHHGIAEKPPLVRSKAGKKPNAHAFREIRRNRRQLLGTLSELTGAPVARIHRLKCPGLK